MCTGKAVSIYNRKGQAPVYTQGGSKVALHVHREGRFSLYTHQRGRILVSTQGMRKGRGKILLCTHRGGLWILTGIPGSPEGPASPSSPVLPYTSEEILNSMFLPFLTQLCLLSPGENSHLPVLPSRLWTLLVQGAPARTGIGVRVKIGASPGSELKSR